MDFGMSSTVVWNWVMVLGAGLGAGGSLLLAMVAATHLEEQKRWELARKVLLGAGMVFLAFYLWMCRYMYETGGADQVSLAVGVMVLPFWMGGLILHLRHR